MTTGAVFTDKAREAIYEAAGRRCIGCGRSDSLTCQHRNARGMGGTRRVSVGHPSNGLALCGSGTWGCHGWTEANPTFAGLLGWSLGPGEEPLETPFWQRLYEWRLWAVEDGFPYLVFFDPDDLDRQPERDAALRAFHLARDVRLPRTTMV